MAPRDKFISTAEIVKGPLPQLGYQLQLAGPDVEAHINAPEKIRSFIKGMYGGRTSAGQAIFTPQSGLKLDALESVGDPPLMNQEVRIYWGARRKQRMTVDVGSRILRLPIFTHWLAWSL